MRYVYLLLVVFALYGCSALVPVDIKNGRLLGIMPMQYGKVYYQGSFELKASREEIFRQARRWAAFHMYSPANALAVSDNMLGDVISLGTIDARTMLRKGHGPETIPPVIFAVSIECLENQYRVTFTNFKVVAVPEHPIELRRGDVSANRIIRQIEITDEQVALFMKDMNTFLANEIQQPR